MQITIPQNFQISRLDAALAPLLPGMGLRGRRRLCESGKVLVNGKVAAPAFKVRPGDTIEIADVSRGDPSSRNAETAFIPAVVARSARFAALCKPAGIHSESLAGGRGSSVRDGLAAALPGWAEARLLNRLDCATSGLVMAAADMEAELRWRGYQEAGFVDKRYLAVVCGACAGEFAITARILVGSPRMVRVAHDADPDPGRHTFVKALAPILSGDFAGLVPELPGNAQLTLVECRIAKGARHQIRAHLASAGLPILGDVKYGGIPLSGRCGAISPCPGGERFFLHHWRIAFPGFSAVLLPDWLPKRITLPGAVSCAERAR